MSRDGFTQKSIDIVAKRSGYRCSNPGCRRGTVGPSESDSQKHDLIGVAAHISAASVGGPRYNPNLTAEERASIENAIHFWSMSSCDIKESLEFLNKLNPLRAASQQAAWLEINQVKSRREGNRTIQIFTIELFREGLRTIMNEVILGSV